MHTVEHTDHSRLANMETAHWARHTAEQNMLLPIWKTAHWERHTAEQNVLSNMENYALGKVLSTQHTAQ